MNVYLIDQNPTDARYTMNRNGVCQTVTARFGTGGGNTPIVIIDGETDEQTQQPDSVGCAEQTHLYD